MEFKVEGIWVGQGVTSKGTFYFTIVTRDSGSIRFWLPDGVQIADPPAWGQPVRVVGTGRPAGRGSIRVQQAQVERIS